MGQSAVDVYALTYSDLHCIGRDALIEVLEFYPEFAIKFAKNLMLSYNLRDEVSHKNNSIEKYKTHFSHMFSFIFSSKSA